MEAPFCHVLFEIYNLSNNVALCVSSSHSCQMCLNEHDSRRRFYRQKFCFHCQCVRNNVMDFSGSLSAGRFTCINGIVYRFDFFLSFFFKINGDSRISFKGVWMI